MVDGSALKKLIAGFSAVAVGGGGGGGGDCATFFFPQALSATTATAARTKLTRRFVISYHVLLGVLPHFDRFLVRLPVF
jgi:hypothetical protein